MLIMVYENSFVRLLLFVGTVLRICLSILGFIPLNKSWSCKSCEKLIFKSSGKKEEKPIFCTFSGLNYSVTIDSKTSCILILFPFIYKKLVEIL